MTFVGINGFGRIGKCIFLQLLREDHLHVKAINAPDFDITKLEAYLKNDSVHHYAKDFHIDIQSDSSFTINGHLIHILRNRDAEKLPWKAYHVEVVIEASGAFLTKEKAFAHDVDKLIMCAPAKDDTPLYVYGANHKHYNGEKIISNASCTTNCITPVLKHLEENYGIQNANFTTIHASTASQKVVDTAHSKSRTNRSIFNNIIPHTTGASSSISKVLPCLKNKVAGTSVRVPVNNVSLVDLNVELTNQTSLEDILASMKSDPFFVMCQDNLVSSDYISTTCPSIVDVKACMHLGDNRFKLMIWYDNEWSYSHQVIEMVRIMQNHENKNPFFLENVAFQNREVVIRLDLNVPIFDGRVTSDFRITSCLPTLSYILKQNPKRLIIMSHLGRPKSVDLQHSLIIVLPYLEKMLNTSICFLGKGLSNDTLSLLNENTHTVYLMENLRFHKEETNYSTIDQENEALHVFQRLGNCYVNDAFGCMHRKHLSICGSNCLQQSYGYLVHKELEALHLITKNPYDKKVLSIIGGGKMDDKMDLLRNMCKKVNTIYVCGGNINTIVKNNMQDYLEEIRSHKAQIVLMEDGLCAKDLVEIPYMKDTNQLEHHENFFDIGIFSLQTLALLIQEHDIIFWNGTLGVVENDKYKKGSEFLVQHLINHLAQYPDKRVIIGGGDTGGFANHYKHNFTHISTGGGASIEYITFDHLVGLEAFSL